MHPNSHMVHVHIHVDLLKPFEIVVCPNDESPELLTACIAVVFAYPLNGYMYMYMYIAYNGMWL